MDTDPLRTMCSLGFPAGTRMPNGGVAAQVNTVFPRTLMSSSTSDKGSRGKAKGSCRSSKLTGV
jgi:hypothetical protein